ncbi:VacJ family lipoprotein OS=Stutzerimonas stutzeri OX=316 GN=CXK95_00130 PE=3 SV=1 [Stutzerimonas stutzeri]
MHDAGVDASRILLNTTFGVLGFFDVAVARMGLAKNDEDFGQTLVESGGRAMDRTWCCRCWGRAPCATPQDWCRTLSSSRIPCMDHVPSRNVTRGVDVVDTRAGLLSAEKMITGDKYVFIRNAYLQNREFRTLDGQVEDDF